MKLKLLLFGVVLTAATLIPTPAIGQDAPMALQSIPIRLQSGKEGKFLGENKNDFATMDKEPGGYIFWSTDGYNPDKPLLQHGKSYKIQLGKMYLYCTAQGNAGLYTTAEDDKSSWEIVKQKQQSNNDDDNIRYGDVIKLRNVHHKTSFLYDDGKGYAAAGNYPNKPQEWTVTWRIPKAVKAAMPENRDIISQTVYVDNRGGPAANVSKEVVTLSINDSVGVSKLDSKDWNAGVSVTATTASGPAGAAFATASLSVTASASYGGIISTEVNNARAVTQGKSVEVSYDKPSDAEVLLVTQLSVPYANFELSCEGAETVKMRSVNGSVSLSSFKSIYIPRITQGKREPVNESEVNEALGYLARLNPVEAERIRKERLPVWQKNGWVTASALPRKDDIAKAKATYSGTLKRAKDGVDLSCTATVKGDGEVLVKWSTGEVTYKGKMGPSGGKEGAVVVMNATGSDKSEVRFVWISDKELQVEWWPNMEEKAGQTQNKPAHVKGTITIK